MFISTYRKRQKELFKTESLTDVIETALCDTCSLYSDRYIIVIILRRSFFTFLSHIDTLPSVIVNIYTYIVQISDITYNDIARISPNGEDRYFEK